MPDISDNTNYSETDSANQQAPPNGWPEGQLPSTVNDCARQNVGALKRFWNRINPVTTITPSGANWTLNTSNAAFPVAYTQGERISFKPASNGIGNDQLQINSLGFKPIWKVIYGSGYGPVLNADIVGGCHVQLVYDSTLNSGGGAFLLQNPVLPINSNGSSGFTVPGSISVGGNLSVTGTINNQTAGPFLLLAGGTVTGLTTFNSFCNVRGDFDLTRGATGTTGAIIAQGGSQTNDIQICAAGGANLNSIRLAATTTQATGALTAGSNCTFPGITYSGSEGHVISFGWDGTNFIGHVDGTNTPGALASQSWVNGQGFATQSWVNGQGFATQSWVNGQGFATQSWVNGRGFVTGGPYLPTAGGTVNGALTVNSTITNNNNIYCGASLFVGGSGGPYWLNNSGYMYTDQTIKSLGALPTANNNSSLGLNTICYSYVCYYNLYQASARSEKTDIAPVEGALARVMALAPKHYYWKEEGGSYLEHGRPVERKRHAGFIADEVAAALGRDCAAYMDEGGTQGINPTDLLATLWAAVRELAAMVKHDRC